ncbi:hypothetical protein CLF_112108 [Clonorchis sinensis]|uniref:Uncharacterized protein n=1 Tax=Clonorchis sinensis TaxID=79923 RepID=G7YVU9_CLOSI|nr:hypothetical protein CLF_112108 [Clonorchis sinensis]
MEYADIVLFFQEEKKAHVFLNELTKVVPSYGIHSAPTALSPTYLPTMRPRVRHSVTCQRSSKTSSSKLSKFDNRRLTGERPGESTHQQLTTLVDTVQPRSQQQSCSKAITLPVYPPSIPFLQDIT